MPETVTRPPGVSVIVPFFDSERYIRACVESLLSQEQIEGGCELIFVNNGSSDTSPSIVADYPELIVLDEPTQGAYTARNTGLRRATAPLVAFTDADCQVAPDWLRAIQDGMADPSIAILIGHCRYPQEASLALRALGTYENAKTEYVVTRGDSSHRFAYANNMAVRASVFEEVGPFKEWKRAADSELVHRVAERRPDLNLRYHRSMRMTHMEFTTATARLSRLAVYSQTNAQMSTFRELSLTNRLGILLHMLGLRWSR